MSQMSQACSIFLLLHINIIYYQSLKILSYTLYNNLTDETQAAARSMSASNRQATFSLYTTTTVMKLRECKDWITENGKIVSKGCNVCIDSFTKTGTNAIKKNKKTFKCCFIKGMLRMLHDQYQRTLKASLTECTNFSLSSNFYFSPKVLNA